MSRSHRYYYELKNQKDDLKQYIQEHAHVLSSNLIKSYESKLNSMTVKMLVIDEKNEFIIKQLKAVV